MASFDSTAPVDADRRRLLGVLGAGAALLAVGCRTPGGGGPGPTTTSPGGTCVLTPEQTEGPYYLDNDLVRSDIVDGHPGTPLRLELVVQDPSCAARPGAAVDIWHCDAAGVYSGFGAGASDPAFLRGTQVADGSGRVVFETIYPGWYVGRATHIHVKVHDGVAEIHTGQLYFDEALTDAVYATAPYSAHRGTRTRNAGDLIYRNGGASSTVAASPAGPGYVGQKTLVVA